MLKLNDSAVHVTPATFGITDTSHNTAWYNIAAFDPEPRHVLHLPVPETSLSSFGYSVTAGREKNRWEFRLPYTTVHLSGYW